MLGTDIKGSNKHEKIRSSNRSNGLCSAPVMAAEQGGFSGPSASKVRPEDSRGRTAA